MKTPPEAHGRSFLPEGELRCVWMTAGLITWRLCRRGRSCGGCLLDRAMKEAGGRRPAQAGAPSTAWVFPDDRQYAPFHTWARPVGRDRLQVGVDVLAAELIPTPERISMPNTGDLVVAGTPSITFHAKEGDLELFAPASGRAVTPNPALAHMPELVKLDPYEAGWIMELELENWGKAPPAKELMSGSQMRHQAFLDAQSFQQQVARDLLVGSSGIGPTLADGGEPILDLRVLLGSTRHLARVQELLR